MAEATPATAVPNARLSGTKRKKSPGNSSHAWDSYLHKVLQDNHPDVKITKEAMQVWVSGQQNFPLSEIDSPLGLARFRHFLSIAIFVICHFLSFASFCHLPFLFFGESAIQLLAPVSTLCLTDPLRSGRVALVVTNDDS